MSNNLGLITEKKVSNNSDSIMKNKKINNNIKIDLLNYNQPINPNLKK